MAQPGPEDGQPEDSDELRSIFEEDQSDRSDATHADSATMVARDERRYKRLLELLDLGAVVTAADHYHAAMVFQHGGTLADYRRASELANIARRLGDGRGAWLAAAALDRWLMTSGRPQRFGTQYQAHGGRWVLWPVDETTTDDERSRWDVPLLDEALARAERMTADRPPADPSSGGIPSTVKALVGPDQLKDQHITVTVPWATAPVTLRLPPKLDSQRTLPIVVSPGAGEHGHDLWVRIVLDDGPPPILEWQIT